MSSKHHLIIYIGAAAAGAILILLVRLLIKRRIRKTYFLTRWQEATSHCSSRKDWPKAVILADALLEEGLKKRRYKGKTTGERLVTAQHSLTNNESVWFGHKLSQRIEGVDVRKLRKQDILEALQGFRQALRDIGVLEVPKDD